MLHLYVRCGHKPTITVYGRSIPLNHWIRPSSSSKASSEAIVSGLDELVSHSLITVSATVPTAGSSKLVMQMSRLIRQGSVTITSCTHVPYIKRLYPCV